MAKRLHIVEEKFLKTIKENNLIKSGDVIVVGVSGGPDSITLLTCFNKYKQKLGCELVVVHVNHLIREDSTIDEQFVENICKNLNIKFYLKRANILEMTKEIKGGTEEVARKVRYKFFDEIFQLENATKIAIAHNMNDNSETMLLNLIRGTGLNGLEGIQPLEYEKYVRPLINCTRKEIEDYCEKYSLNPRIDSTNKENIYTDFEFDSYDKQAIFLAIEELNGNTKNLEMVNIEDIIKLANRNIGNKFMNIHNNIKIQVKSGVLLISQRI